MLLFTINEKENIIKKIIDHEINNHENTTYSLTLDYLSNSKCLERTKDQSTLEE